MYNTSIGLSLMLISVENKWNCHFSKFPFLEPKFASLSQVTRFFKPFFFLLRVRKIAIPLYERDDSNNYHSLYIEFIKQRLGIV